MIDLSIIIVSYNEKEFIKESIDSCLKAAAGVGFEIIIGDDGSSDGSLDVIGEYKNKFPETISTFIVNRDEYERDVIPSIRVSNIIKRAIKKAKGDYVLLLSADDYLLESAEIKKRISFMKENPEVSACYTDFVMKYPNGKGRRVLNNCNYSKSVIWGYHYIHISSFIFRKKVEANFLKLFCDDVGAVFSILKSGDVVYFETCGFVYRQRKGSIMHKADSFELNILEMLLYQDVLSAGGFRISTISKMSGPLKNIYINRDKLKQAKYRKYLECAEGQRNNYFEQIMSLRHHPMKRLWFCIKLLFMNCFVKSFFHLRKVVEKVLFMIFKYIFCN